MDSIRPDDKTITYLLGYLTPKQWAHAMKLKTLNQKLIMDLIQQQENTYGGRLKQLVLEEE